MTKSGGDEPITPASILEEAFKPVYAGGRVVAFHRRVDYGTDWLRTGDGVIYDSLAHLLSALDRWNVEAVPGENMMMFTLTSKAQQWLVYELKVKNYVG